LAVRQAELARDALITAHGWAIEDVLLVPMVASGDRIIDRPLADVGGKALWTKELDLALTDGRIDAAVHSMKDVETFRPTAFVVAAVLERADVRDRLIGATRIADLPPRARVGTSSPRRSAQLLALRPDLELILFRGNVATRLAKLAAGVADATLLAAAGLDRLGQQDVGHAIAPDVMLPAPAQGAIGIEVCAEHDFARAVVSAINHAPSCAAITAERALLEVLGADCRSPVAALVTPSPAGGMRIVAQLLAMDGSAQIIDGADIRDDEDARAFGRDLLSRAPASVRALFAG
jgi:hydroxymethylbilane synthase